MNDKTSPSPKEEEITEHPDNKIDEDFKGYPHGNASNKMITPETDEEKTIAGTADKDGEKRIYKKNETDEQDSDGSASAFKEK